MVVAVDAVDLVKPRAGGNVHLAADDGLDARRLGGIKKCHAAVHNAVVGYGAGGLPHLL